MCQAQGRQSPRKSLTVIPYTADLPSHDQSSIHSPSADTHAYDVPHPDSHVVGCDG